MTSARRVSRSPRAVAGWRLEWEADGSLRHLAVDHPIRIGRDPKSDVILADPTVSREHCVVSLVAGRLLVDATASRNGVRIDRARADKVALAPGQAFTVGGTVFRVVADPARAAEPIVAADAKRRGRDLPAARSARPRLAAAAVAAAAILLVALTTLVGSFNGPTPLLPSPDSTWRHASIGAAKVALRYPPGWTAASSSDGTNVSLTPPASDPSHESPNISIAFLPGVTLDSAPLPANTTGRRPTTIAGLTGWEADDRGPLPPSSHYVALPVAGGVLFAQAYAGPYADLSPTLDAVLTTVATGQTGVTP